MGTATAVKKKFVVEAVPSKGIPEYDASVVYEDYDESGAVAQMIKRSRVDAQETHKYQFRCWPEGSENFTKAIEMAESQKAVSELAKEVRKTTGLMSNATGDKKIAELEAKVAGLTGLLERLEGKLAVGEDASEELKETEKAVSGRKRGRPAKQQKVEKATEPEKAADE